MGHCPLGSVTFDSAAYVARYCMKKVTGDLAESHYAVETPHGIFQREPEFAHMSLKPGIGYPWFEKYCSDVYPRDYVVIKGVKTKPPKYYDRQFELCDPVGARGVAVRRARFALEHRSDGAPSRLIAREKVAMAKFSTNVKERGL